MIFLLHFALRLSLAVTFNELTVHKNFLLFNSILSNEHHVLHKLLPNTTCHTYSLRNRRHNYTLSNKTVTDERNFITRLLHKDMY